NPSAHRAAPPCSVESRSKLRTQFRLRQFLAGSPNGQAETGLSSYGLLFHLLLLSTSPRGDAVTIGYRPECVYLKRTRTSLARYIRRRTRCGILPLCNRPSCVAAVVKAKSCGIARCLRVHGNLLALRRGCAFER